jgi:hypothetical protein
LNGKRYFSTIGGIMRTFEKNASIILEGHAYELPLAF